MVEPLLGPDAVYLGEVPHEQKLELLGGAAALLFPIRWNEPFGLVMLEAWPRARRSWRSRKARHRRSSRTEKPGSSARTSGR